MASLIPVFLNGVYSTVQAGSSAIGSATATGVNVATGDGAKFGTIGTNQYVPAVIVDTSTSPETIKEYVWITAVSTDALTVTRGAEDSGTYIPSTTSIQSGYTIAAVASKASLLTSARNFTAASPHDYGLLGMTFPPPLSGTGNVLSAGGALCIAKIYVPVTISVTNILTYVSTAGSGLTASQCFAGIYDSAGNKLAGTGDQSTSWNSTGLKTMAISGGPVSITGGTDTWVWGALLYNGTTSPSIVNLSSNNGAQTNFGLAAASFIAGTLSNSYTALPASFTPSTMSGTNRFWLIGLS